MKRSADQPTDRNVLQCHLGFAIIKLHLKYNLNTRSDKTKHTNIFGILFAQQKRKKAGGKTSDEKFQISIDLNKCYQCCQSFGKTTLMLVLVKWYFCARMQAL